MGCLSPNKPRQNNGNSGDNSDSASLEQLRLETKALIDKLLEIIKEKQNLRSVPTAQKIFRASQNKFKAAAFHRACHNVSNTILIACSNNSKRVFGGFTPCPWKQNECLSYEEDPNAYSFVFSVKDGSIEVFEIKEYEKHRAIMNDDECGPIFGEGHDIYIRDDCDKVQCWNNLGKTYASKFRYGSVKSNSELSDTEKHLIRDYEIWAVTL